MSKGNGKLIKLAFSFNAPSHGWHEDVSDRMVAQAFARYVDIGPEPTVAVESDQCSPFTTHIYCTSDIWISASLPTSSEERLLRGLIGGTMHAIDHVARDGCCVTPAVIVLQSAEWGGHEAALGEHAALLMLGFPGLAKCQLVVNPTCSVQLELMGGICSRR